MTTEAAGTGRSLSRGGVSLLAMTVVLALGPASAAVTAGSGHESSFGPNGASTPIPEHPWRAGVFDMARDARGRLVVAGGSSTRGVDGQRYGEGLLTARFRPDGTLDRSFGEGGFGGYGLEAATGVAIQRDGRAVVAGYVNSGSSPDINYRYEMAVARLNRNGTLDRSFSGGYVTRSLASAARDIAIRPGGRIVGVGIEVAYFQEKGVVFGLKPNGRIDRSFGRNGRIRVFGRGDRHHLTDLSDILVQPDGKLLIVGMIEGRNLLMRLLPDGRPDSRFGGGDGRVAFQFSPVGCQCSGAHAVRRQSDGRIVVLAHEKPHVSGRGGRGFFPAGRSMIVARFLPSGRLDRSFGPSGRGFVRRRHSFALGLAVQRNDKIVVAGERAGPVRKRRFVAMRFLRNGGADMGFASGGIYLPKLGLSSFATSAVALPDGGAIVAGTDFTGSQKPGSRRIVLQRFAP